jgi:hypothetical protein
MPRKGRDNEYDSFLQKLGLEGKKRKKAQQKMGRGIMDIPTEYYKEVLCCDSHSKIPYHALSGK